MGSDAVEQRRRELAGSQGDHEAGGDAGRDENSGLAQDHRQNGAPRRAERHPHADLVRSPRYAVGDHAVEPEQRK
jgi:hypothetical protein